MRRVKRVAGNEADKTKQEAHASDRLMHIDKRDLWFITKTRMWANAQGDGRPAEYRWRPLFNVAKFGRRQLPESRAVTLPRRETC